MNEKLTQELYTFLSGYVATPSPRDFAIAEHFYILALTDVKREIMKRWSVNRYLGREELIEEDLLILDFIDKHNK